MEISEMAMSTCGGYESERLMHPRANKTLQPTAARRVCADVGWGCRCRIRCRCPRRFGRQLVT